MAGDIRYANPPVVEAVIDIQVHPVPASAEKMASFIERVRADFPLVGELRQFDVNLDAEAPTVQQTSSEAKRLANNDRTRYVTVRPQGLSVSHMAPYTQWEPFSDEAERLWKLFVEIFEPQTITRCAVRFINRLKLPGDSFRLEDYLALAVNVPSVYEPLTSILLQVQGHHADIDSGCRSLVSLASEIPTDASFLPMLFDIDIFVEKQISPSSGECWNLIKKLRTRKNQLFEAALTEKMKGAFK